MPRFREDCEQGKKEWKMSPVRRVQEEEERKVSLVRRVQDSLVIAVYREPASAILINALN